VKKIILFICLSITLLSVNTNPIEADPGRARSKNNLNNEKHINVSGSSIDITLDSGEFELPEDELVNWISSSAKAVSSYYGRFPVRHLSVFIHPTYGGRVGYGRTTGSNPPSIMVNVGRNVTKAALDDDWVMTHEMVHLGFPSINGDHSWIEEGMATYIEPFARARIGKVSAEQVWTDLVRNAPNALTISGDRGLEDATNFRQIYWGGALFWLLADVEIHKKSANRRGLEDVFRGILADGGTITADWDLMHVLNEGDKAARAAVFKGIYSRLTVSPIKVDLEDLWTQLGIELHGNTVEFNDRAPLASIRLSITKLPDRSK